MRTFLRSAALCGATACVSSSPAIWDIENMPGEPVCLPENVPPPPDIPLPTLAADALRGMVLLPHPEVGNPETTVTFTDHAWISEWVMPTSTPADPDAPEPALCPAPPELWRAADAVGHVDEHSFDVVLFYRVPHDRTREPTLAFYETDVRHFGWQPALDAWWDTRHEDGGLVEGTLWGSIGERGMWQVNYYFLSSQAATSGNREGDSVPLPEAP